MNRIDDGKFNLKGNNESFSYLGNVSPEEEARLAEIRKKKSKKKTRLIAGLLAGGTLIGGITASYLKNNALISPYTSDIGQELFNTPEYKEIYKKYKNPEDAYSLNWSDASNSIVGFYEKYWGMTEEEAKKYTNVHQVYFTDEKIYVISGIVKGARANSVIYSMVEYDIGRELVNELISFDEQEKWIEFNLLMQYISKKFEGNLISQFYEQVPKIVVSKESGLGTDSGICFYNYDEGFLSGYCFLENNGKLKIYYVYSDAAEIKEKDNLGVFPGQGANWPVCERGTVIDNVKAFSNFIVLYEQQSRDLGLVEY